MSGLDLMLLPFLECLVLVGIHSYLGLHVIRRRVIFVDLALAQMAALGTSIGFIFHLAPDSGTAFAFSLGFTAVGAAVFALSRMRNDRIPQEAVIGLVYAITAAVAVLVIQKTHGAEHLESILVGGLLWVKSSDVWSAAAAYGVIGAVHWFARKRFLLISEDPEAAWRSGIRVRMWDFLFYLTFGIVITFSVRVAGVLLVFVFLVAPAILALMFTDRMRSQLFIGWGAGTLVTVLGLYLSYQADLPTGPTVIAFYGVVLAAAATVLFVVRSPRRGPALLKVGVGTVAAAAVVSAFVLGGLAAAPDALSGHTSASSPRNGAPAERLAGASAATPPDEARTPGADYERCADADECLAIIRALLGAGRSEGVGFLIRFLADAETPPFYRMEALTLLQEAAGGRDFGYAAEASPEDNRAPLEAMRAWAVGEAGR